MADEIKCIRVKVGMFDGNSFKKIKRTKIDGISYRDILTAMWFELLDLAGKSNTDGYLIDKNSIPFSTYEDIAIQIDRDAKEVEICLNFFETEKMIEFVDGKYCLKNFVHYQNQEGLDQFRAQNRERQARFREKKNRLLDDAKCQYCGGKATGYDHIIPLSHGGSDDASNKVHCCKVCNNIKSIQPLVKFLNANRERINDDIVTSNSLLMKYVTLDNVTNRYVDNVMSHECNTQRKEKVEQKEKEILLAKDIKEKITNACPYAQGTNGRFNKPIDMIIQALTFACLNTKPETYGGKLRDAEYWKDFVEDSNPKVLAHTVSSLIRNEPKTDPIRYTLQILASESDAFKES